MYKSQVIQINKDLKKTRKAIIAIGCSFVQGQGAFNDDVYQNYKWNFEEGQPLTFNLSSKERKRLTKSNPILTVDLDGTVDFTMMEYDNAFVNVLCKKYFKGEYTPINLGLRGCGNRGSIKELYMYPDIMWNSIDEIIVLYVPSGLERFDFINDQATDHFNWICMWPHYENMPEGNRRKLWEGYSNELYSEKFQVLEQIIHVQELLTWCENKKAKLIITPGFDRRYDREYFKDCLLKEVSRNNKTGKTTASKPIFKNSKHDKSHLIDLFPWKNMFKPDGNATFAELVISKEVKLENKQDHYMQFLGKGSPDGWITPCSHPSRNGHDLFAQHLHDYITNIRKS